MCEDTITFIIVIATFAFNGKKYKSPTFDTRKQDDLRLSASFLLKTPTAAARISAAAVRIKDAGVSSGCITLLMRRKSLFNKASQAKRCTQTCGEVMRSLTRIK